MVPSFQLVQTASFWFDPADLSCALNLLVLEVLTSSHITAPNKYADFGTRAHLVLL